MAVTPYEEKKYVQSDAVTQAQQALTQQQANRPGQYQSQFQSGINDLAGQIQNRPKFQYDVNADALYQQVAQNYLAQGRQAMMDTMGQAAALTGGYGNSYAQNVGQQAYNQHILGLTEMVPQFQQMAFQQYQAEGDDLMNRYNVMLQQDESAYARYQDDLNRYFADLDRAQAAYYSERDYDYGRFADDRDFGYGKYMDALNHQYRQDRDQVEDQQWQTAFEYQKTQDQLAYEQWLREFEEDQRRYDQEWAAAQAAAGRSSSGNGTGNPATNNPTSKTLQSASDSAAKKTSVAPVVPEETETVDRGTRDGQNALRSQVNSEINAMQNAGMITAEEAAQLRNQYRGYTM